MKVTRIKNDTPDWFDLEISEKIDIRNKLFHKFKRSNLNIDWELYTEARNSVFRVIKNKKEIVNRKTLEENVNNPKKLWDTIKSLGLPSKHVSNGKICLKQENKIVFNTYKITENFKEFFSRLASNLVSKLPPAPNIYII